jgi:hypothetical protein
MGLFKDWAKANVQATTLTGANTPDRLYAIWESYTGASFATFAAYARSRANGTASTADIDPAARATKSVTSNGGGVTVRQLDAAFERVLTASSWGKKLASQARAAYAIHKGKWGVYTQGNSYSVYFDEQSIVTSGRPKGGYRLDIENIRAGNTPNFV